MNRRGRSEQEFDAVPRGFTAVKRQREVGTGYCDAINTVVSGGESSPLAPVGSTEEAQFHG